MKNLHRLILSISIGLLMGAALAALFPGGVFWIGWLSGSLLITIAVFFLLYIWQWAGGGKTLGWLIAVAFLLRLVLGTAVSLALPVYGYDQPEQKAGYLYSDAYHRDADAWFLARNDRPISSVFTKGFASDQYGGLLALSVWIYRYLSPDAQRAYLILILGAFFMAFGAAFFYRAIRERWGPGVAGLSAWILVLYPDGILFTSSQMREPYLIGLTCVAIWGVVAWGRISKWAALGTIFGSLALLTIFSVRIALPVIGVLAVWFFLDTLYERIPSRWKIAVWAVFALAALCGLALSWEWFASSVKWDLTLQQKVSGLSENAIKQVGELFRPLYYTIYGVARPLLPAAIAATRPPWIWKTIDIFRSAGWYLLIPLLGYGIWSGLRAKPRSDRRILIWIAVVIAVWTLISSARAAGDQWDNPRYRTIFLPWMALLAGWGVCWAWNHRDAWLLRFLAVEVIFLSFFTQWYLARYWSWLHWVRMPFWAYPVWILVLSGIVLIGGWLWDRYRAPRLATGQTVP